MPGGNVGRFEGIFFPFPGDDSGAPEDRFPGACAPGEGPVGTGPKDRRNALRPGPELTCINTFCGEKRRFETNGYFTTIAFCGDRRMAQEPDRSTARRIGMAPRPRICAQSYPQDGTLRPGLWSARLRSAGAAIKANPARIPARAYCRRARLTIQPESIKIYYNKQVSGKVPASAPAETRKPSPDMRRTRRRRPIAVQSGMIAATAADSGVPNQCSSRLSPGPPRSTTRKSCGRRTSSGWCQVSGR